MSVSIPVSISRRLTNIALPIFIAGMDACWIYIAAWLFNTGLLRRITLFPLPSPLLLAALELAAWWLAATLLDRTRLPQGAVQTIVGVAGLAVAFGTAALLA